MRIPARGLLLPILLLAIPAAGAQGDKLRSPWDDRKIALTAVPYECPAPPPFAKTQEIGSYYIDNHASVIDPQKFAAFQKASEASGHLSQYATLAADAYLDKGSRAAALCVFSLLDAAAKADAWDGKMSGYQGVYLQNWLLSAVGIAYLKVRPSGLGTAAQQTDIQKWFGVLAVRVGEFFDAEVKSMGENRENNHLYWAGLAIAADAIANNDNDAGQWALNAFRIGLENIQPDGSLKAEMDRGQMALHYHLYALAPLIMLAEMGEANRIDFEDPTILEKRTGVTQVVTLPYGGSDIGWAVPYVRRFPDANLSALIAKAPWVRYTTWGGEPPE